MTQTINDPVNGWFDISSAPKDGKSIIITCAGKSGCSNLNTYVAKYLAGEESLFTSDDGGAWICYMDIISDPQAPIEPTHWRPMPPPPVE